MCSIHPGGSGTAGMDLLDLQDVPQNTRMLWEDPKPCPKPGFQNIGGVLEQPQSSRWIKGIGAGMLRESYGIRAQEIPKRVWEEEKQAQGQPGRARAGQAGLEEPPRESWSVFH